MKRTLLILLALPFLAISQTEKGIKPITNHQSTNNQTRAVVIGISDYQDEQIPDLRFADKDALAFANYLRSPSGGGLSNDQLTVLTNSQATAGRVAEALDALVEQTKEGDQVIIYFSGHGDVERKTVSQPGFLLCWDAPSRVYMGGGTYSLAFLQEIVSTLSTQNHAKVVVVTDACHAGKLAGSQIGGAQLTAANLAKQFANEVKILSCQPGELSLEGEQWGGGRGIFSFHLVDGLFGLADKNGDGQVSLGEIDRYLEDNVTAEAAPQSQVPMLLGNKTERLAAVNAQVLADLKKAKTGGLVMFTATESRGFEGEIFAKTDSSLRNQYLAFKNALAEKRFFSPENDCAERHYAQIIARKDLVDDNESHAPLRNLMKRNYAAALQDEVQTVLNLMLKGDVKELRLSKKSRQEKYAAYPRYLERAAELLGKTHYMYPVLQARKHFFQGYLLAFLNQNADTVVGQKALDELRLALRWQPEMPHVYMMMGAVFGRKIPQIDSMRYYSYRAAELAPTWIQPYIFLAHNLYLLDKNQLEESRQCLEKATLIDSASAIVWNNWGIYYLRKNDLGEAERCYKKALELDSTFVNVHGNLGAVFQQTGRLQLAEEQFKTAARIDPTNAYPYQKLGYFCAETQRPTEAAQYYQRAVELDSTEVWVQVELGGIYLEIGQPEKAAAPLKTALRLNPNFAPAHLRLACLAVRQHQPERAFESLEAALKNGCGYMTIQEETDLAPLRALPEWKVLMKKYFPEKVKD